MTIDRHVMMNKYPYWILLLCLAAMPLARAFESVTLSPATQPLQRAVPRIGLNLGGGNSWGAEQLMSNLLQNPGFEAPLERSLVIVKDMGRDTVTDDTGWLGRPEGYWDGAQFDVRTGAAAGSSGRVLQSTRPIKDGPNQFYLDPFPSGVRRGDALSVSITRAADGVAMWWSNGGRALTSTAQLRPGSPGHQSAHLIAAANGRGQLVYHMDMIGERAGKLLLVNGNWKFSFWARGGMSSQVLHLRFLRHARMPFLQEHVTLERDWKFYSFSFRGNEAAQAAPSTPLELSFEIEGGEAWFDDAQLGDIRPTAGGFRSEVINLLRQLKPGYLRDWQGQLGDTVTNRLAEPFARHPSGNRPGNVDDYPYSLPQFFELCAAVDALPWVVAPSLASDAEWLALGAWLKQAALRHGFREIMLEFGNENWNAIFRPAGFMNPLTHAEAADRAFRLVKKGAAGFNGLVTVVNAQFVNPDSVGKIAHASREASKVAVAPYFLLALQPGTQAQAVAAAFADDDQLIRADATQAQKNGKQLAVYEVNFHTTEGEADSGLRNTAVSGAHAGAALARRLLQNLQAGVREQAVFSLAGFDNFTETRQMTRLWGITRDLAPGQLRPTGLALQLLNEAVAGDAYAAQCAGGAATCKAMTAVFFRQDGASRLVVTSASAKATTIRSGLPCSRRFQLRLLDGSSSDANNETTVQVALRSGVAKCTSEWQFELPAYSVAVLAEQRAPSSTATGR